MKLKFKDRVVLSPKYAGADGPMSPVWGGTQGYQIGVVQQIITHDHDAAKHCARVKWENSDALAVKESDLLPATPDMEDFAKDFGMNLPFEEDYGLLYWNGNQFGLGVVECGSSVGRKPLFTLLITRFRWFNANFGNSDCNLLNQFFLQKDLEEHQFRDLHKAVAHFHDYWGLPEFRAFPLPCPTVKNLRSVADQLNTGVANTSKAFARFQLPTRFAEIVSESTARTSATA